MKRYWLILTMFAGCILVFETGCRESGGSPAVEPVVTGPKAPVVTVKVTPPPEVTKKGPRIKFDKVVHDFGEVGPGTTHQCEFKFTNVGDDVLEVEEPTSSCSCTVAKLDKKAYAAGESGVVRVVKFRVPKGQGVTSQPLTVRSNDRANQRVRLTAKATVALKVAYQPKRLRLFLDDENSECPEIKLNSLDGKPFAIKSISATSGVITADYDPSLKATSHVIQPKINFRRLQNRLRGQIHIKLTHPGCDTVTIPFDALPRFKLDPPSIVVWNVEPEKPVKKVVWLLNNYGEDFEVESVSSDKDIIKLSSQDKVGKRYKFELEITPPADKSIKRFTDVFRINVKGGAKLSVDCSGFFAEDEQELVGSLKRTKP